LEAVRAAVTALVEAGSMSDLLRRTVAFGGDADTVAAIALAAGAHAPDLALDLPEALIEGLEDGPFGATYLRALDTRLLTLVTDHA
jgi:ADP-ribosylglycohydrolase